MKLNTNIEAQILKLPAWVQAHIKDIQRQRDVAVQSLMDWSDSQTEQPISVCEMVCVNKGSPSILTRYIEGSSVTIKWAGVELSVTLRDSSSMHDNSIGLQWHSTDRRMSHVSMVPNSFQSVSLISKENMR